MTRVFRPNRLWMLAVPLFLSLLLFAPHVSQAQSVVGQFVLLANGDLWTLTADGQTLTRQTTWLYNQHAALSPDGNTVAYSSWAREAVVAGGEMMGDQISNIWLMDLTTGEFSRIAAQPAGATAQTGIIRSAPAWSPDGTQLAWEELIDFQGGTRLIVYTVATGSVTQVAQGLPLGFQDAGLRLPAPDWGAGIAHSYFSVVGSDFSRFLRVADPAGAQWEWVVDQDMNSAARVALEFWTQFNGSWMMALGRGDGSWELLDAQAGTRLALDRAPVLAPLQPLGLSVVPFINSSSSVEWRALRADGQQQALPNSGWQQPAFAPDGQTIAFVDNEARLQVWRNGSLLSLPAELAAMTIDTVFGTASQWTATGLTTPLPALAPAIAAAG